MEGSRRVDWVDMVILEDGVVGELGMIEDDDNLV